MLNLKNKQVVVMGLGLHGGGLAVTNWLLKKGSKVTVTDLKTAKELKPTLNKINPSLKKRIVFVLGKHREIDFKKADIIVQGPGVPTESKYLKIAKKSGVAIENDASLFFKHCKSKNIIGVTGTRGKSTTSALIRQLLNKSKKTWLAGQSQKPELEIVDKIKSNDLVVLELSSWQLEILGQLKLSPAVSVVTNIYPDHLNRYSGMKSYIAAKKNIFTNQSKNDFTILNLDNAETKKLGKTVPAIRFWFSKKSFKSQNGSFIKNNNIVFRSNGIEKKLVRISDIKLRGDHNLENVLAAVTIAGIFKVPTVKIKQVLSKFSGLPDRMELVKEVKGVKYVNDTTSTTPDAAIAALSPETWNLKPETRNIILIAGGSDKKVPQVKFDDLAKQIKKTCKAVILFKGQGSNKIKKSLNRFHVSGFMFQDISNMSAAIKVAQSIAKKGDIVLLSPACASFGLFVNEFDRGDQFKKIISKL